MNNEQRTMNNERRTVNRENLPFFLFSLLFVLLLITCDLFNGEMQDDHLKKIDDEILWSKAVRLDVRVDYPSEWGSSPQQGALNKDNTRKGYAFGVEFTSLPGFGFEEWLAFPTSAYSSLDFTKTASQVKGDSLNGRGVDIPPELNSVNAAGAQTAKVTINITESVTLVPWCSDRPRLSQRCNPPLNQTMIYFPYDQQVIIWFNMMVKREMVEFGENRIVISGYNQVLEQPVEGDLNECFTLVYSNIDLSDPTLVNTVTLVPIPEKANELANLEISVKVGSNIENKNGITMAQAETISYQTNAGQAQRAYRASDIAVTRPDGTSFFADSESYQWGNIDRRFQTNKEVPLSFKVSWPEGAAPVPNKLTIIERMAYKLDGSPFNNNPLMIPIKDKEYPSGFIYSSDNASYTITHELQSEVSGIIQLLVLPWNDGETPAIFALDTDVAVSESRYVTIVIDIAAPGLADLGASLSNESSMEGTDVYVYGSGRAMTLTVGGLGNLADNGSQGGILAEQAQARGLPWTMDDKENLRWYAQIGRDDQTEKISSGEAFKIYKDNENPNIKELNNKWEPANLSGLDVKNVYSVYVQFEDSLGNVSGWIDTRLRVKYSEAAINSVSNLRAVCNAAGNSINITWDQPAEYLYPEVVIQTHRASANGDVRENVTTNNFGKTKAGSYTLSVPSVITGGVRNGNATSGVYGYEIKVITYNTAGIYDKLPSIWVYNIPGMDSNIIRIEGSEQLTMNSEQLKSNIVLTRDITISSHTPIGDNSTDDDTSRFTGKFYGNGHKITINSFVNKQYTGLFGYTDDALIRDLTLEYHVTIESNAADDIQYLGGIAGHAGGTTDIRNIITGGSLEATLAIEAEKYIGGITGYMGGTMNNSISPPKVECDVTITNIRAGLDLTVNAVGTNDVLLGGITGDTAEGGTGTRIAMSAVNATGALTHRQDGGTMYTGGIAGRFRAGVRVGDGEKAGDIDIEFSGSLTANKTGTGETNAGGIWGYASAGFLSYSRMSGSIEIPGPHTSGGEVNVGGLLGSNEANLNGLTFNSSYTTGNINCNKTGNGDLNCGGLIGLANALALTDCWYEQGTITVGASTGSVNLGGGIGSANGTVFTNCRSLARNVSAESSQNINIGGFIGLFSYGEIVASYARTEVDARGGSTIQAGGFAGTISPTTAINTIISQCYATGNVDITSTGNYPNAGGLIGVFEQSVSGTIFLTDSYSLGNVSVKCGMRAYAGGLVGHIGTTGSAGDGELRNCFSTGNVSAISTGTGNIDNRSFSGGLVARITNQASVDGKFTMKNNAALGDSVTIMTTYNDKIIGRVYSVAYTNEPRTTTVTNNYAKDSMRVEVSNDYNTYYFPYWNGINPAPSLPYYTLPNITDGGHIHGANTAASTFYTRNFWKTDLNFSDNYWDFSTVISRGYPLLKDVGGQ
jgi:hypothetical protein